MTPEELTARTQRAVAAAVAAAMDLDLEVRQPVVLHDVFSAVVHLSPLPLVARVPMVLPAFLTPARLAVRQQRELDVTAWLAERGFPVVAPSPLVPRVPVQRDGFSITFWELVDVADDHVPYGSADAALVVGLHEALREYPAERLVFMAPVAEGVPSLLEALERAPERIAASDLERIVGEWEVLRPILTSPDRMAARFPGAMIQAVHGDAPAYNLIRSTTGVRFADFEDVNLAPIEWDLAGGTPEDVEKYTREAAEKGLRTVDSDLLALMTAARMLQTVGSLALVPQLPLLATGLAPMIEAWRAMPFAGGFAGDV